MRSRIGIGVRVLALAVGLTGIAAAQPGPQPVNCPSSVGGELRLAPSGVNENAVFGSLVEIDGSFAAVSAPGDPNGVSGSGAVWLFRLGPIGWQIEGRLIAPAPEAFDRYGDSIGLSGDTLVVGAHLRDGVLSDEGAAYVYRRNPTTALWELEATLSRSDPGPQSGNSFGHGVAIDGHRIVVGSTGDDDAATDAGAFYVFDRVGATWSQTNKVVPGDGAGGPAGLYGARVAVDGDTIVVSDNADDTKGPDAGAIYVYDASYAETKLFGADSLAGDGFGFAIDVDGDLIIAGAPGYDEAFASTGTAYLFERSGGSWSQIVRLKDPNAGAGALFGHGVAIDGGHAVAGAPGDSGGIGATHVIVRKSGGGWTRLPKLVNAGADPSDPAAFGIDVAASGLLVLGGALAEDGTATDSGAAYSFTVTTKCPGATTRP